MDVLSKCIGTGQHTDHILHIPSVPGADGLVEGSGLVEPGERASDARSERGRERVGAGERTAGEVSTHIPVMSVTELVSQLLMAGLSLATARPKVFLKNSPFMSVTPVVHDLASFWLTSLFLLSISWASLITSRSPSLSRFVYVTPLRVNVPPTATPGHLTVTPLDAG